MHSEGGVIPTGRAEEVRSWWDATAQITVSPLPCTTGPRLQRVGDTGLGEAVVFPLWPRMGLHSMGLGDFACAREGWARRLAKKLLFSCSVMSDSVTPWTAACQASLSFTISWSLSTESVMPFYHLILICPLLLLPSIFPSIRVFYNKSALRIRWSKDWSFSFSISPSNEYSGLIFLRIDWFDLLTVQGTLKSLLQHHSLKTSNAKKYKR